MFNDLDVDRIQWLHGRAGIFIQKSVMGVQCSYFRINLSNHVYKNLYGIINIVILLDYFSKKKTLHQYNIMMKSIASDISKPKSYMEQQNHHRPYSSLKLPNWPSCFMKHTHLLQQVRLFNGFEDALFRSVLNFSAHQKFIQYKVSFLKIKNNI